MAEILLLVPQFQELLPFNTKRLFWDTVDDKIIILMFLSVIDFIWDPLHQNLFNEPNYILPICKIVLVLFNPLVFISFYSAILSVSIGVF
ncbi:hypothetical protein H5410_054248 [Solanum commersonii]|uniref:Uncharacterized protein n=1 Tax=Solanum commersonii TaxID=4109 RepID=A0A9J5X815_SOLCO|nr:hypothetical protein H5410_054248 [Solanum commersonii]